MTTPTTPTVRQPAYDAVYEVIRRTPARSTDSYGQAAENARVWRAVEAALDAMDSAARAQAFREAADMVANCKPESTNGGSLRALEAFQTAIAAGLRISAKLTESAAAEVQS